MKKHIALIAVLLYLTACTPSDAKIEAALKLTQTAQPTKTSTYTLTPKPTNTPEPTVTPSPSYPFIENLSYSLLEEKFLNHDLLCGEREFEDDGSYEIECAGSFDDGLVQGIIKGYSKDTVSAFFYMVVPFVSASNEQYIKDAMKDLIDFGDDISGKQAWINDSVELTLDEKNDDEIIENFPDVQLIITGGSGIVSLIVIAYK